jgi:hypothetical protein
MGSLCGPGVRDSPKVASFHAVDNDPIDEANFLSSSGSPVAARFIFRKTRTPRRSSRSYTSRSQVMSALKLPRAVERKLRKELGPPQTLTWSHRAC